jgi:hypothetical protein
MKSRPANGPPHHNGIGVPCAVGRQLRFRWPVWVRRMDGRRIKSIAIDQFDNCEANTPKSQDRLQKQNKAPNQHQTQAGHGCGASVLRLGFA